MYAIDQLRAEAPATISDAELVAYRLEQANAEDRVQYRVPGCAGLIGRDCNTEGQVFPDELVCLDCLEHAQEEAAEFGEATAHTTLENAIANAVDMFAEVLIDYLATLDVELSDGEVSELCKIARKRLDLP